MTRAPASAPPLEWLGRGLLAVQKSVAVLHPWSIFWQSQICALTCVNAYPRQAHCYDLHTCTPLTCYDMDMLYQMMDLHYSAL